jgi:hypothetical protein
VVRAGVLQRFFAAPQQEEIDVPALLEKIQRANAPSIEAFHQDGEMVLFDVNGDSEKVMERASFVWQYDKTRSYYRIDSVVQVRDGHFFMQVDLTNRVMAISLADSSSNGAYQISEYLKLLQDLHAEISIRQEEGMTAITIDSLQHPAYQGFKLFVDPTSLEVRKLLLGMNKLSSLDRQASVQNEQDLSEYPVFTYFLEIRFNPRRRIAAGDIGSLGSFVSFNADSTKITAQPNYADFDIAGSVK